eukprot:7907265-Alexandrium_andersonii.AAC.1
MSASLVGSEMCIRDRQVCMLGRADCRLRLSAALTGLGRMANCTCGHHGTVSYTHLTLPTICSV